MLRDLKLYLDQKILRCEYRADKSPFPEIYGYQAYRLTNFRYWPILLKNSVFTANEKILAPLANLIYLDTRGYKFHSKACCEAPGAAR
jgi:hypothetical protein